MGKQCALPIITTIALRQLFVATHALGHMMSGYTLLVPVNQRVLNKLSMELNTSGHEWSMIHRMLKFHRNKIDVINM